MKCGSCGFSLTPPHYIFWHQRRECRFWWAQINNRRKALWDNIAQMAAGELTKESLNVPDTEIPPPEKAKEATSGKKEVVRVREGSSIPPRTKPPIKRKR